MNFSIYYYVAWMTAKLDNYCWKNYGGRRGEGSWYLVFLHEWNITSLLFSGAMYFTEWSRGVKFGVESWSTFLEWGYQKKKIWIHLCPCFFSLGNCFTFKRGRRCERIVFGSFSPNKIYIYAKTFKLWISFYSMRRIITPPPPPTPFNL